MEKIKVNMSPNPLDVQTIHASQNDGEARQWGFELHNNGELIDTSDVSEQMFFKAYKGGTEQILPENTSTPTTSPFKGDIKYPQGLLSDQEFLYRESPTEEDGLAKITDIKGNTIVWNQLVDISVVPSSVINGITYERQAEEIKATGTASADSTLFISGSNYNIYNFINGHSYYLKGCPSGGSLSTYYMSWTLPGNDYGNGRIAKATSNLTGYIYARIISGVTVNNLSFKPQLFDLTSMGIDDLTTPTQVEEWLSNNIGLLPYYAYNQGTLLSFMGNGIKTVGKNLIESVEQGAYSPTGADATNTTRLRVKFVSVQPNTTYSVKISGTVTFDVLVTEFRTNDRQTQSIYQSSWVQSQLTFTTLPNCYYVKLLFKDHNNASATLTPNMATEVQLEKGSAPSSYEPYTSSTLSLPVSTYFPNGMDGVGDAYDELTNSGYAKRMGRIDLGSITYTRQESQISGVYFFVGAYNSIPNIKNRANSLVWNIKTPLYETAPSSEIYHGRAQNKTIGGYDAQTVRIRDDSFTDPTDFKNSLGGQYLVYELATPTETSFTTASLVTENAEIPLSNENGVLIGKCTEQLSSESGFFDAKIKLADEDGECYSNKIQLHVERSPQ